MLYILHIFPSNNQTHRSYHIPQFFTIQACRIPILRHVLSATDTLRQQILFRILKIVLHFNDETSLYSPNMQKRAQTRSSRGNLLHHRHEREYFNLWQIRQLPPNIRPTLSPESPAGFDHRPYARRLQCQNLQNTPGRRPLPRNCGNHPGTPAIAPHITVPTGPSKHQLPPATQLVPDTFARALRSRIRPASVSSTWQEKETYLPDNAEILLEKIWIICNFFAQGSAFPIFPSSLAGIILIIIAKISWRPPHYYWKDYPPPNRQIFDHFHPQQNQRVFLPLPISGSLSPAGLRWPSMLFGAGRHDTTSLKILNKIKFLQFLQCFSPRNRPCPLICPPGIITNHLSSNLDLLRNFPLAKYNKMIRSGRSYLLPQSTLCFRRSAPGCLMGPSFT